MSNDKIEKLFYGFSSTEFIEDFEALILKRIQQIFEDIQANLVEECSDKKCVVPDKFEASLCMNYCKDSLKKFEIEAKKLFAIPEHVTADQKRYSEEELSKLETEVFDLERKYLQKKLFLEKINRKKECIEQIIQQILEKQKLIENYVDNKLILFVDSLEDQLKYFCKQKKIFSLQNNFAEL